LVTVDVFDTILTRRVVDPPAVFLLLGHELVEDGLVGLPAEPFARIRASVEGQLVKGSPTGEVPLEEIYRELARRELIPNGLEKRYSKREIALETRLSVQVPGSRALLEKLRRLSGGNLIFLSDTYLPSTLIESRLHGETLLREGDRVVCSCEEGVSKARGALFEKIRAQARVRPSECLHVGNEPGEIRVAKSQGWHVLPTQRANPNRYERILEEHRWETQGLSSLLAGASRMARLSLPSSSEHAGSITSVACGVAAPVLISFLLWIGRQVRESQLERAYFVSRDGEILLKIARTLGDLVFGPEVELRYLFGGREAWHLAASDEREVVTSSWFLENASGLTVRQLLHRAGIEGNDVDRLLKDLRKDWRSEDTLGPRGDEFVSALGLSNLFQDLVRAQIGRRRSLALAYLQQEGLLDGKASAVVDLGWLGRSSASLLSLMERAGGDPSLRCLFFGLAEGARTEAPTGSRAFAFDERAGSALGLPVANFLEAFCAGTHGQVLGYEERDGTVQPMLSRPDNPPVIAWGLTAMQEAMGLTAAQFAHSMQITQMLPWNDADLVTGVAAPLLEEFIRRPTPEEARAWGSFPHDEDQLGEREVPMAPSFRLRDLWTLTVSRVRASNRSLDRRWFEGRLMRSPLWIRGSYRIGSRISRQLRRMKSRRRSRQPDHA
jgi:FMN phosphatase YigB (HAD superfamily)